MSPALKDHTRLMYDTWPIDIFQGLYINKARQRRLSYFTLETAKNSFINPSGILKKTLRMIETSKDKIKIIINNIDYAYHYKIIIKKCNRIRLDYLPIGTQMPAQFYHIHCSESTSLNYRDLIMPYCVLMDFFDELIDLKDLRLYSVSINDTNLFLLFIEQHIATSNHIRNIAANKIQNTWRRHWEYVKNTHKNKFNHCMDEILYSPPSKCCLTGGVKYNDFLNHYNYIKTI